MGNEQSHKSAIINLNVAMNIFTIIQENYFKTRSKFTNKALSTLRYYFEIYNSRNCLKQAVDV